MSVYTKQLADVYYDEEDGAYRADVEYYDEENNKIAVPVEFPGTVDQTFSQIREKAYALAAEHLTQALKA